MRHYGDKRFLSCALTIIMALVLSCGALVGCGKTDDSGSDSNATEDAESGEADAAKAFVGTWVYDAGGNIVINDDESFVLTWPDGQKFNGTWELKDEKTATLTVTDESFPNEEKVDDVTLQDDGTLVDSYGTVLKRGTVTVEEETDATTDDTTTDDTTTDGTTTDDTTTDGTTTDGTTTDGTETYGTETDGTVTDGTETDGATTDTTGTGTATNGTGTGTTDETQTGV